MVDAADHTIQVKLDKKRRLADQAKVAAGEVEVQSWNSVRDFVRKEMALASAKKATTSSDKVSDPLYQRKVTNWSSLASFIQEASSGWRPETIWKHVGAEATFESVAEASRKERSAEGSKASRSQSGSRKGGERKGQGSLSAVYSPGVESIPPPSFYLTRYDAPSSYPDWLLTIPRPIAIDYLLLCMPIDVLSASQYKESVHLSPGVEIPKEISYELSVGMRFMFHSKRNSKLIKEAWNDFVRRLRWRLYFSFTESEITDYDPDYEVDRPKKRVAPPSLPQYMELGILRGWDFVRNTILKIPEERREDIPYSSLAPPVNMLRSFLIDREYVITMTDKNLGIAVSKKEWIIEKCIDLLNDKNNYKERSIIEVNARCNHQCEEMSSLGDFVIENIGNQQLATYLRSKVTPFEDEKTKVFQKHVLPVFYGIPKIHKEPVKMRPIIPCHSAIQNPAAKFVSKKLKPIVAAATTIIHGSKDLALKLSKLSFKPGKRLYICTGDVVAFYPSIPIQKCMDIVLSLYEEYIGTLGLEGAQLNALPEETVADLELFTRCLLVGNTHLITQFQGKYYEQIRGLAMGVSDSPDLANCFGWYFERKSNVLKDARVAFYGRYIDDVLALIYASTETEARGLVEQIKFDDCVIEWDVSGVSAPFLDMLLYNDSYGLLQHMPYRKARNHQERVPWISHHPLDVKRGTFIGEMSRLATLSSTHASYLEALKFLGGLYVKRGYPLDAVKGWLKKYTAERWSKRLNETLKTDSARTEVLVLKSEFNTAWNFFSATQLGDTMIGFWREYLARADAGTLGGIVYPVFSSFARDLDLSSDEFTSVVQTTEGARAMPDLRKIGRLNRRMLVSRKRTRNLFDLTTLWKKMVLTGYDREVSDHPGTTVDTHIDGDNEDSDLDQDTVEGFGLSVARASLLEAGVVVRDGSPTRTRHGIFLSDED